MSFLHKMQYTKANTEQDSESQENLLSEEESHVQQPEKAKKKWRQGFLMLLYMIGTALACLAAGLVGYNWDRDMNGVCIRHISEPCKTFSRSASKQYNQLTILYTQPRCRTKLPSTNRISTGHSLRRLLSGRTLVQRLMLYGHPSELIVSFFFFFFFSLSPLLCHAYSLLTSRIDRPVRISSEDARKANIPQDYVKIDEKYGGGHPVSIEGFHHLHCLVSQWPACSKEI